MLRLVRGAAAIVLHPVCESDHLSRAVVVEIEAVFRSDLRHQAAAVPDILLGLTGAAVGVGNGLLRPEPAVVVGKAQDVVPPGHPLQLPAALPLQRRAQIACGIAYVIIGDA